jgi:hypothetical protein
MAQVSRAASPFAGMDIRKVDDLPLARARIAFRDIARPTDTRTTIVALLPPDVAVVHNAPYLLRRAGDEVDEAYVLGVMSSIPFDWYIRRVVELHMTFEILTPVPIPRPARSNRWHRRVVEVAGRLAAIDGRFARWASAVDVPVGSVGPSDSPSLEAELDAVVAHLYGLSRPMVEHMYQTFHRGWNYSERLARVLEHYDRWAGEGG